MIAFRHAARFALATFALCTVNAFAADNAADIKALEAVDHAWLKAFTAADAEGLANLYDEKAVLLPPNAPAASGRAAIKAALGKESSEAKKAGMVFNLGANPAGGVSGDMGWQSGSYTIKDKAGKVVDAGKYLSVSMKKGGKWLYVRDTWNSDNPPAPAAAPTAPAAAAAPAAPPKK